MIPVCLFTLGFIIVFVIIGMAAATTVIVNADCVVDGVFEMFSAHVCICSSE
jgi:hypothetical protein